MFACMCECVYGFITAINGTISKAQGRHAQASAKQGFQVYEEDEPFHRFLVLEVPATMRNFHHIHHYYRVTRLIYRA